MIFALTSQWGQIIHVFALIFPMIFCMFCTSKHGLACVLMKNLDMYFLFWQNISLQSLKCNNKNEVSQLWNFNLSPCKISLNIHAFAFVQSFPMHWWMMERSFDWNLLKKKILKNPNAGSWISKDYIMVWRKIRIISILFFTVGTFVFVHIRMK